MSSNHNTHNSLKSIYYALTANAAIAVTKTIAAIFTGSGSMMAESVHSFADTGNQLLLLLGLKRSKQGASKEHPLGYGKAIYFWSFIVALMLFSMGGLFSIYEGIHKLITRSPIEYYYIAVIVLSFSVIAEFLSLLGVLKEINKIKKEKSLWEWFQTTKRSELVVVLGEDSAAVLGLLFALIAVILSGVTGNPIYDSLGSIFIGLLLVFVAIQLGIKIKSLMIGERASEEVESGIIKLLNDSKKIKQIYHLISIQLGEDVMISLKVKMSEIKSAEVLVEDINYCEKLIHQNFPEIKWIFFEPDNQD